MRLTKISAVNFKGRTFEYELPPKLAIIGRNFVGKSAVIDAIRWLLMGYVPEVGKLNSALWEYSSGDFMEVSGELISDTVQQELHRRLESVRGTVKASGNVDVALIPGLNSEHYFGLSDRERVNYVFSAVPMPKEFSPETLLVEWDNINIEGLAAEDLDFAKKQLTPFGAKLVGSAQEQSIDVVLAEMREQFTYWNRREKDTIGAVRTLTELKLRENEVSSETLAEVKKEAEELANEAGELSMKIATAEGERLRWASIERDRAGYQRIINADSSQTGEIKRLEKLIDEAKGKLKPVIGEEALRKLDTQITDLAKERDQVLGNFAMATNDVEKLTKQASELKKLPACPYCQSHARGWKKNVEADITARLALAQGMKKGSTLRLEQIERDMGELRNQYKADEKAVLDNMQLESQINLWTRAIATLVRTEAAFVAERDRAKQALANLPEVTAPDEKQVEEWEAQRDKLRAKIAEARTRYDLLLKLQQDLKRAAESSQEHNRAVAMVKVIKKAAEILQERKKAMVEIVFSGLLKTANSIFGSILKSPLAFFDNTIGRWEGAKFIPHRVFSGTEKALCYTAISAALSTRAPMKLAIIDEFQRLDATNQARAVHSLSDAVDAGVLEQFIIVATEMGSTAGDCEFIRL